MRLNKKKNQKVPKYQFQALAIGFITLTLACLVNAYKVNSERPTLSPLAENNVITITYTTEKEVYRDIKISEIVDKVHLLESSRGKAKDGFHMRCKEKGMSNEYGYGVYQELCFRTHKEATAMIYMWFATKLETLSLGQALCLYNTGTATDTCHYYQNYLEVK